MWYIVFGAVIASAKWDNDKSDAYRNIKRETSPLNPGPLWQFYSERNYSKGVIYVTRQYDVW